MERVHTLRWEGDWQGSLWLIDQTLLPTEFKEVCCRSVEDVWQAIRELKVRGAPAIGVAAAYGVVLALQTAAQSDRREQFFERLKEATTYLATARPTAVNLFWALDRMTRTAEQHAELSPRELIQRLLDEARLIEQEDRRMCEAIGKHGAELLPDQVTVLTHCNAGSLATAGDGTALAVIYAAARSGKKVHVYADETRPLLQGARLTAWELQQHGIPVTVICDNMAAWVIRQKKVDVIITGADRIAANGDTANKIGTYGLAVQAHFHKIPLLIAAPSSTFDLSLSGGDEIPIEERRPEEITKPFGRQTVPDGVAVYNPAFDVTPAELIKAIVTEKGVIQPVTKENIQQTLCSG